MEGPTKRKRRATRNWYWPEEGESDSRERSLTVSSQSSLDQSQLAQHDISKPLGLLRKIEKGSGHDDLTETKSAFAQALDDYDLSLDKGSRVENDEFARASKDILSREIKADLDARIAVDKLARSLSVSGLTRELLELSPRIAALLKSQRELLNCLVEICQSVELGIHAPESMTKVFEQLNRIFDAQILPSKRERSVADFLKVLSASDPLKVVPTLQELLLAERFLLLRYPERAAELLLSALTAARVNMEELGIRAYKFDKERSRTVIRVFKDSLEMDQLAQKNGGNYFSFLFSTIALNALLQERDPKLRLTIRQGKLWQFPAEENELKKGLIKVQAGVSTEFPGFTYEDLSWINRQFAGQRVRGRLPERLRY